MVMSMKDKAEEIINKIEKDTGNNPDNYPSPEAPGTTLQNNTIGKSTRRNTGQWLDKRCFIVQK